MTIDELPLISADSHVEEPSDLWQQNLPARICEQLPPEMQPAAAAAREFGARIGAEGTPRERRIRESSAAALRGASLDLEARFAVLREDGVAGECIYPTSALSVWNVRDADAGLACCRLYNDWIHDLLGSKSPRFRCAGLVPTWRVGDAIAEARRIADLGLASAMLPLVGTPAYNHRDWEPLWAALEEIGLPVVMHQGTGHDMLFYRGRGAAVANLLATQSMAPRTAALLVTSGVLAEHPRLHFVFVETNAGWMAWAMDTLDHYAEAFQEYAGWVRPVLPEPPSFYVRRQLHATFQVDPGAIANVGRTGVAALLWGSDYPHAEGTHPHSRQVVARLCQGLAIDAAADIVGRTAARLFRFEPEVLTTAP